MPPVPRRILESVERMARTFFKNARGSHGWDHTRRVTALCLRLGRKERADLGILKLAALLHDIGRAEEDLSNGRICHAKAGAALARTILAKHGLDGETISSVVHCIATHRFRNDARPASLEARILYDADKLDSIGALGIGRAFLFSGEVGARLHNSGANLSRSKPYTSEDTAYREYMVKLRKIKDRMRTAEGRRIAAERHAYMAGFFARLNKETKGIL